MGCGAVENRKPYGNSNLKRNHQIYQTLKIERSWQYHRNQQEDSARDFASEKDIFPQEYFVYFKGKWRISGTKDRL